MFHQRVNRTEALASGLGDIKSSAAPWMRGTHRAQMLDRNHRLPVLLANKLNRPNRFILALPQRIALHFLPKRQLELRSASQLHNP